jgi:hypothetical protein
VPSGHVQGAAGGRDDLLACDLLLKVPGEQSAKEVVVLVPIAVFEGSPPPSRCWGW